MLTQIKASAGSGKTYTLTESFLKQLQKCSRDYRLRRGCQTKFTEDEPADWRSVMAITFTNAAAAEMQHRVLERLKKIALGKEDYTFLKMSQKDANYWLEQILHDRASLNISTIDSLLNLVLRLSALSENLPPDFTPVFSNEELLDPLLEECIRQAWDGDQELKDIIQECCRSIVENTEYFGFTAKDALPSRLREILPLIFRDREYALTTEGDFGGVFTQDEEYGDEKSDGLLPVLRKKIWDELCLLSDLHGQVPPDWCLSSPEKLALEELTTKKKTPVLKYKAAFQTLLTKLKEKLQTAKGARLNDDGELLSFTGIKINLKDFPPTSEFIKQRKIEVLKASAPLPFAIQEKYQDLLNDIFDLVQLEKMYRGSHVTAPIAELVRRLFSLAQDNPAVCSGLVPNDCIPLLVRRILGNEERVSEAVCRLGNRIRYLFIDEFQDTSREQWDAIKLLIRYALNFHGDFTWVGDVKQAIYGFRGGDPELFDDILVDNTLLFLSGEENDEEIQQVVRESLNEKKKASWEGSIYNAYALYKKGKSDAFSAEEHASCLEGIFQIRQRNLDTNWRSAKKVVAFNNALFTPLEDKANVHALFCALFGGNSDHILCRDVPSLFKEKARSLETPLLDYYAEKVALAYKDCSQKCAKKSPEGGEVRLIRLPPKDEASSVLVDEEEESLPFCRTIYHAVLVEAHAARTKNKKEVYGKIYVLVRKNEACRNVASYLSSKGIPVLTENSLLLKDHPLIVQTIALIGILANAEDDIAFWTLVTGTIFTGAKPVGKTYVSELSRTAMDEAMLNLAGMRREEEKRRNKRDWRESLLSVWKRIYPVDYKNRLQPLLECVDLSLYDIICEWYRREEVFERFPDDLPFLLRFQEVLAACIEKGISSPADFLSYWEEAGAEEKIPMPENMDAVHIMTFHKAKGLEGEIVIVPWLNTMIDAKKDAFDIVGCRLHTEEEKVCYALCQRSAGSPLDFAHKLRNSFESINSLYVACTRARRKLYLITENQPRFTGKILEMLLKQAGESKDIPIFEDSDLLEQQAYEISEGETIQEEEDYSSLLEDENIHADFDPETIPSGAVLLRNDNRWPGANPSREESEREENRRVAEAERELRQEEETEVVAQGEGTPSWNPLAWRPLVSLHEESDVERQVKTRDEGTFLHNCLQEFVEMCGDTEDIQKLIKRNLAQAPLLAMKKGFAAQVEKELTWLLVRTPHMLEWVQQGIAEHSIIYPSPEGTLLNLRMDLFVPLSEGSLVFDYKHGHPSEQSMEEYLFQITRYLQCLKDCGQARPVGVLLFLTEERFVAVNLAKTVREITEPSELVTAIESLRSEYDG